MTQALYDVIAERQRHIHEEGWSLERDDKYTDRSLAQAAACYTLFAAVSDEVRNSSSLNGYLTVDHIPIVGWWAFFQLWPWNRKWWKPTDRRRDLVKAGALILAEIERLDRAAK